MAASKGKGTAKGSKKARRSGKSLREQWEAVFGTWRKLLPGKVIHGWQPGEWRFQLENDAQKLAAGWEPTYCFHFKPDGTPFRVDYLQPPQALHSAAWILAEAAKGLADRAAQLRIDGSRELREFAHALRFAGGISRNPLLLWEDGLEHVVADVLAAHEASEPAASSRPERGEQGLDLVHDPACKSIRDILRAGPRLLGAIKKDQRLIGSGRGASDLLRAMEDAGMVEQTKKRGPWRFVSDTPRK